jgi:gamma-glutamyltranspeptidase/glutathione hydrolase
MFSTRPEIVGTFGVVTSTHWLATAAGMSMLENGGNAFDAAVATGLALHIVEPDQNGPGGDTPLILYSARHDEVKVICGQGTAPRDATASAFHDLGLDVMPGIGLLPAVVPGSFGAWMLLLGEYGSMSVSEVMAPAISYARNGFAVSPRVCNTIAAVQSLFTDEWTSSAEVFLPNNAPPKPGELFRTPAVAATFERVLAQAAAAGSNREAQIDAARMAWYEGFVAEAVDRYCASAEVMDTTGNRNRAFLTGADMAGWSASLEDPTSYDYHDYTVCKTGPWGQGPVALQQLALLKDFDLAGMAPDSAEFVHLVTECAKLAMADREAFYGDPDFVEVPVDVLLSDGYNAERRKLVGVEASYVLQPGTVAGFDHVPAHRPQGTMSDITWPEALDFGGPRPVSRMERAVERAAGMQGDTCHFDIIDRHGNMISGTPSGGWLHGAPVVPGLGFALSARGQMFSLNEAAPSCIAPGKRPRTTLTPGLALKEGVPYMAFGTPGGDQQDQWALHAFLRHVHHGLNLQQSIDAPEFHTSHAPSSFFPRESRPGHLAVERRLGDAAIADLAERGHGVEVFDDYTLGYVTAATREGGLLKAGASPRNMQCYAAGR